MMAPGVVPSVPLVPEGVIGSRIHNPERQRLAGEAVTVEEAKATLEMPVVCYHRLNAQRTGG